MPATRLIFLLAGPRPLQGVGIRSVAGSGVSDAQETEGGFQSRGGVGHEGPEACGVAARTAVGHSRRNPQTLPIGAKVRLDKDLTTTKDLWRSASTLGRATVRSRQRQLSGQRLATLRSWCHGVVRAGVALGSRRTSKAPPQGTSKPQQGGRGTPRRGPGQKENP